MEQPRISLMECLQNEKHIVVDPLSLKNSPNKPGYHDTTMLPSIITTTSAATILHPPTLQPPKPRFLSMSLPNSANSSPRFASALSKKKSKSESPESQCHATNLTYKLQHLLQEMHLRKSKSCGEGRACAPSDEFDHWLSKLSAMEHDKWHHDHLSKIEAVAASFVFEKDLKGVLKNGSSRGSVRKSDASPRHVRFSTSSSPSYPASPASCISPRLRKAREDFNAFLAAAQSA